MGKNLNRNFSEEATWWLISLLDVLHVHGYKGNENFKNMDTHRIARIKKTNGIKSWQRCEANGTLIYYWWKCKSVTATLEKQAGNIL